ncbi:MAG: hypothetical protein IJ865_04380, partial [Clostridia bacterium]|nr:hypothetical protein [Clostridia bacterium]
APKLEMLDTPGPRLLLLGGSNVPFALRSKVLEEALGDYTVIDFGLYADLGIPCLLDLLEKQIRAGDMIIVQPELTEQTFRGDTGGLSVLQALDGIPGYLLSLRGDVLRQSLSALPVYLGEKLRWTVLGKPAVSGIYVRSSFDTSGDIREGLREGNIMPMGHEIGSALTLAPFLAALPLTKRLNRFSVLCTKLGAQLLFHFPPLNGQSVADPSLIDSLYLALQSQLTFPLLGNPQDCILESSWFYDTDFHLNDAGAIRFTRLLLDDIRTFLEDTAPNPIPLPETPRSHLSVSEDTGDEDAFLYTLEDESFVITGLTARGKQLDILRLPGTHEGLPVRTLSPESLQGARATVVQVPAFYALPDGMLAHTSVRTLTLLSPDPSAYSVGDALLEDSSAMLSVPESALETYRRHYLFHRYADRMQAKNP